jgi:predicted phosphoadenosine phosphosulfate sulfurtransferase
MEWVRRCYLNGIPDEVPAIIDSEHLAPSWKRIALALIRNDMAMESLGNMPRKSQWYSVLKRIELKKDVWVQLMLF